MAVPDLTWNPEPDLTWPAGAAPGDLLKGGDGPLTRGWQNVKSTARQGASLLTGDAEAGARIAAERAAYRQANPGSPEGQELMAAWESGDGVAGGIANVAGEFAKDWREAPNAVSGLRATGKNLLAMGGGIVEQVPNMLAPMTGLLAGGAAGGAVAGPVGAALGGWAGATAGNTLMESGEQVDRALQKAGIDPRDKRAVQSFLAANGDQVLGQAATKGAVIGAVDTATLRLGNLLLTAPGRAAADRALAGMGVDVADRAAVKAAARTPEFASRIAADTTYQTARTGGQALARNVAAGALEPAGEFAGEYLGQGLATGDWDTKGAALEAAMALGQSGLTFAGQKLYQAATRPGRKATADASPPAAATPDQIAASNEANAALAAAGDLYAAMPPATAGLLTEKPILVQNPTTGRITELDRRGGPLERAAALAVESGVTESMHSTETAPSLLLPYPSKRAAENYLNGQADPELLDVIAHPVVKGRFAVVPKTGTARDSVLSRRAVVAAKEANQVRAEQLRQEEIPAAPAVRPAPAATPEAKAVEPARPVVDLPAVKAAEDAQDELSPPVAQPVAEMPIARQRATAQAERAVSSNVLRAEQLRREEEVPATVDAAAAAGDTNPTDAQIAAGNYAKGHIKVAGIDIAIENPEGSVRSGIAGGKRWKTKLKAHYGYVKRTTGADKDAIDVYVKPGTPPDHAGSVFVVDQYDLARQFDEHKVLIGYGDAKEASKAYDAHFGDRSGPKRRGAVTAMSVDEFKTWVRQGDTRKPVAASRFAGETSDPEQAAQEEIARSIGARMSRRRDDESADAYQARMADEANQRRAERVRQQAVPTRAGDEAEVLRVVRGMPDVPEGVRVTLHAADTLPDAGTTQGLTRQAAQFVEQVARLFKKRVVFFSTDSQDAKSDGFYLQGNTIYLGTDSSVAHLRVLGHELTHAMRAQAGAAYDKMLSAVSGLLTDSELQAQHRDYFGTELDLAQLDPPYLGETTLRDFLAEEWMADLSGNRFAEEGFWADVFARIETQHGEQAAKGIIARLRLALVNALNKLLAIVKGNAFAVDARLEGNLEGVRQAVAEGFAEYARRAKAGELTEKSETKAPKFSGEKRASTRISEGETTQTAFLEAVPSETTRAGRAVGTLSAEQKTEFTEHIFGRVDPAEVARRILPRQDVRVAVLDSTGGYQPEGAVAGKISPNVLVQLSPGGERPVTREEAVRVAQALNYVYTQDGVPVSRYDAALQDEPNATSVVRFTLPALREGHSVSAQEEAFYRQLEKAYGVGIGYSKIDGKIVVGNYAGLDTYEFHVLAKQVAAEAGVDVERTAAEGDYVFHDWQNDPEGSRHEVWNSGDSAGRSDLQARLRDWRDGALQAATSWLNERGIRFSPSRSDGASDQRYRGDAEEGLRRPVQPGGERGIRFSPSRSDGASDQRLGRDAEEGLRRPVQPESVSAEGVHYSRAQRTRLDSGYFGTGIRGAEDERVKGATDPRIQQRIYFYVNSGRGIRPEEGVGSHAHFARLDNLYDYDSDPLDLRVTSASSSLLESAVLDLGFDGAVSPSHGIAVLLGQRSVPVEYLGQTDRPEVSLAERAEPSAYGRQQRAVLASPALPAGEMTGAEWKRLMPAVMPDIDVGHLDDARKYYRDEIVKRPARQTDPDIRRSTSRAGYSHADLAVFDMVASGRPTSEILGFLSQAAASPFARGLASRLQALVPDTGIVLGNRSEWSIQGVASARLAAAAYNPKANRAALFSARDAARHVLHELTHAATMRALRAGGPAASHLQFVFTYLKRNGTVDGAYGGTNLDEFIAEAFTNPEFQQLLTRTPAPAATRLESMWQWFTAGVARLLGIDVQRRSAFEDVIRAGRQLMGENRGATFEGAAEDTRYAIASDRLKATRLFHSTSSEDAAQQILADGFIKPPELKNSRGKLAPVVGRSYASKSLETASIYSLGGVFMGSESNPDSGTGRNAGRYGYVFEVDSNSLGDVQPDEDAVGELAARAIAGEVGGLGWLATLAKRHGTERQLRNSAFGYYADQSQLGKKLLKYMTDDQKTTLLDDYGAHVAHGGAMRVVRAWKIDKARSKEIAKDGSNLLDVGEQVYGEKLDAIRSADAVRFSAARDGDLDYTDENGLLTKPAAAQAIDRTRLRTLRSLAADLERPRDGIFLFVTDDGRAVATGPKGAWIPETFRRFAKDNGLTFQAQRKGYANPKDKPVAVQYGGIGGASEPMPYLYRSEGARYFGEMGGPGLDRTKSARFSVKRVPPEHIERVDPGSFGWHEDPDGYVYHVTSEPAAKSALKGGLRPDRKPMFGGAYRAHTKGRVFFTERDGVQFWMSRVEDHLFDQYDDPPAVAVLRVAKSNVELARDDIGSEDAKREAYFVQFSPQRLSAEFETKLQEHFQSKQPQPVKLADNTPASLQLFGWKDLPIVVTPNVLDKMHFDHGMTVPQMARLPYLLKRPTMIFADNANKSLVLVGEHLAQGKIALVAVKPEVTTASTSAQGQAVYARTNLVVTGYAPQNGWAEVVKRIGRGELVYRDTEGAPPDVVRAALTVAQKKYAQSGRTLPREVLQGSTVRPVLERAYSVLGQSDLVKLEEAIWPDGAKFSPNRATLGQLTPAQEAAANRVLGAPKTFTERLQEFRKDWAKNLKQGVFDQFAPIQELDPNAYILARLSKGGDSTLEALMLYGKLRVGADGATDVRYTRTGGMQGFASKMAKLKGEHDRFLLWVAAQRADRLKAIGLENLWSTADIAELKTLNAGVMNDGTPRLGIYAQALADLNEFNDNVLEVAVASGLIDDATRQMYRGTPYVPFYRLQEDETVSGFNIKPGLVNQYAWKRLKGGTQKLNEDLLANLLHNWSHLITASARNRAAKATLQAAERAGIAAQVPAGMPGKGHVSFKAAGQEQVFVVSDPHLMDAVAALEYTGLGPWAKPFAVAKHWLTLGVTANPSFKLRNLIRDTIGALGTAQLSYNAPGNLARGWSATAKDSETRAHMLAAGGMIRFGSMLDGKDSQRAKDLVNQGVDPAMILDNDTKIKAFWKRYVRPAFNAYNELGDRGEQINRAALYEQMRAKGMSHAEAAFWARDLMDFSMAGKWTAIRTIAQTVPFFNARLQGLYKLGRAGKQDIRRLGYVLGAVSMASLGLLLAFEDDEDWKRRSDADRNNYWWFKVGGTAFRVPKPFEIGVVGTLAERMYELMASDEMTGERFGKNMRGIVMSQLAMNPTPQLFKPMMDLYANQDSFTGRDIESMSQQRLRKEDRYDERTSEVARFLGGLGLPDPSQLVMGRWETLSPKQMDFLARAYFSWLGTMTTTALDYGIRPLLDRGDRPALQLRDAFLVGSFVETLPSNGSRYVQQLYDQAREVEQAYASYRARLKLGDVEGAQEILADEQENIRKRPRLEQALRAESLINVQLQRIQASTELTGDEKRARMDEMYARRNRIAEWAMAR